MVAGPISVRSPDCVGSSTAASTGKRSLLALASSSGRIPPPPCSPCSPVRSTDGCRSQRSNLSRSHLVARSVLVHVATSRVAVVLSLTSANSVAWSGSDRRSRRSRGSEHRLPFGGGRRSDWSGARRTRGYLTAILLAGVVHLALARIYRRRRIPLRVMPPGRRVPRGAALMARQLLLLMPSLWVRPRGFVAPRTSASPCRRQIPSRDPVWVLLRY